MEVNATSWRRIEMIPKIGKLFTIENLKLGPSRDGIRTDFLVQNFYADKYLRSFCVPIRIFTYSRELSRERSLVGYLTEIFLDINFDEYYGVFLLDQDFNINKHSVAIDTRVNKITEVVIL